jgi:hypothetical protein
MESLQKLRKPFVSYNLRRHQLYLLSSQEPYKLFQGIDLSNPPLFLNLDFTPRAILSLPDYLIIQGQYKFAFIELDSNSFETHSGREILEIQAHPLSDRSIGILTQDGILSIFSLPSLSPDFSLNLVSLSPVSFTFFQEKTGTLFAFGCSLIGKNGSLFIVSPVLPKTFKFQKEVLDLKTLSQIEGNSYKIYEKGLSDWVRRLELLVNPESVNWKKVMVNEYSYLPPVPRGPCFVSKEQPLKIVVVHDSRPSVLALLTRTRLKIIIAAADLIPSFSDGKPSVQWELLEDIEIKIERIFYSRQFLICSTGRDVVKIDFPWLENLKNSYSERKIVRNIEKSTVKKIKNNVEVFDFALIQQNFAESFCFSLDFGFDVEEVNPRRAPEELVFIEKSNLVIDFQLPEVSLMKFDNIAKDFFNIRLYEGEEAEVKEAFRAFNDLATKQGIPVLQKMEQIRGIMENSQKRFEGLNQKYDEINEKIKIIERYQEEFEKKVEAIKRNDETIRNRINEITTIQQSIKKPLTPAEKELSFKLSELDLKASQLKNNMKTSIGELKNNQDKVKSLCSSLSPDYKLAAFLDQFKYQLGEISDDLIRFKELKQSNFR